MKSLLFMLGLLFSFPSQAANCVAELEAFELPKESSEQFCIMSRYVSADDRALLKCAHDLEEIGVPGPRAVTECLQVRVTHNRLKRFIDCVKKLRKVGAPWRDILRPCWIASGASTVASLESCSSELNDLRLLNQEGVLACTQVMYRSELKENFVSCVKRNARRIDSPVETCGRQLNEDLLVAN